MLAQVRRLTHGIFGGLGGVVVSHLLEANRSPELFGQESCVLIRNVACQ